VLVASADRYFVIESHLNSDAFDSARIALATTIAASLGWHSRTRACSMRRSAVNAKQRSPRSAATSLHARLATVMDRIARTPRSFWRRRRAPSSCPRRTAAFAPSSRWRDRRRTQGHRHRAGRGIIGRLLQSGQPEFINDTAAIRARCSSPARAPRQRAPDGRAVEVGEQVRARWPSGATAAACSRRASWRS